MSFQDLIDNASLGINNPVLKRLQRYMANIPGTQSYWHNASKDLEAIILNKGPPHIFFTYTYADNYDPELHRLLGIETGTSIATIQKIIRANPVITQKFFLKKFEIFFDEFVIKRYGCEPEHGGWYWYRFEWQHRGGIHVHGVYRMNNTTPDPYKLAEIALTGYSVKEELTKTGFTEEEWSENARDKILEGILAERDLCQLHDKFICTDLPNTDEGYIRPQIKPMMKRCSEITPDEINNDLMDLKMAVNKHRCKIGACIKNFNGVLQRCRYKFPKELSDETIIKYSQQLLANNKIGPIILNIVSKRIHSEYVVSHIDEHLRVWRANTDSALIHDLTRVLKYIAKYASKPEVKSNPCAQAYNEIFNDSRSDDFDVKRNLKKVMMHVLGQRDVSLYEACHQLAGLSLHKSNILIVNSNLQAGNQIAFNEHTGDIEERTNLVDLYKLRNQYSDIDLSSMNFVEFGTKYQNKLQVIDKGLSTEKQRLVKHSRPEHIALRIFQKFSSNPGNAQYNLYCKYQLLRYKPWINNFENALTAGINFDDENECYKLSWHDFLNSEIAKDLVPDWEQSLRRATRINEDSPDDNNNLLIDGEDNSTTGDYQTEWQEAIWHDPLIRTTPELDAINDTNDDDIYWQIDRRIFEQTPELLRLLNSPDITDWISKQKSISPITRRIRPVVLADTLKAEQRKAFDIVKRHKNMTNMADAVENSQLLMRVEGTAGTGIYKTAYKIIP
jgi:Helitron helicase-like domain at N-terminus